MNSDSCASDEKNPFGLSSEEMARIGHERAAVHEKAIQEFSQALLDWMQGESEKRDLKIGDCVVAMEIVQAAFERSAKDDPRVDAHYKARRSLYSIAIIMGATDEEKETIRAYAQANNPRHS
jgi:hypothetical protein